MRALRAFFWISSLLLLGCTPAAISAAANEEWPKVEEVLRLIRSHMVGATDENLNQTAVEGLLNQLHPKVALISRQKDPQLTEGSGLTKTRVFEEAYGYFRIGSLGPSLSEQVESAYQELSRTNRLKGMIFDLRFAGGQDYRAAAKIADRFLKTEQPLLDWGEGSVRSQAKDNAWQLPLAVLINRETTGAAEALAAVLRQSDIAVLIGSTTAGQALLTQDFPLSNGQKLRIATATVLLGNGRALSTDGVKPDIQVAVSKEQERAYWEDPYKVLVQAPPLEAVETTELSATNRNRALNEAELVRRRREGVNVELPDSSAIDQNSSRPVVRDPALARSLDILKGLAVIQRVQAF